ncbi:MAG: YoaK family protein [Xanthobacteraceae bacterium]
MTEIAPVHEVPPRWVPALLSFAAGYVDSYTFLALFGLFVAQVTGSFVTAGAQFVVYDTGFAGKLIAILAFLVAAALTAALIGVARDHGRDALPWMLALETLLLAVFCFLMLAGPPPTGPGDWHGILAGVFAAMAMGAQSVVVRLLMRGIPQTNVMTGNMTQLGIETTELIRAWRRYAREPGDAAGASNLLAVRARLLVVLSITIGFILGAVGGAAAFASAGLPGIPLAVLLVGALSLWAIRRERMV